MGTFFHVITLIRPAGEETIDALVDTGRLFAIVPASIFARLGIKPGDQRRSGEPVAQVKAVLNGEVGWAMCVFGPDNKPPRIGRYTLDSFVLDIDKRERLVPKILQEIRHF
jgi:predicted aspartyl protease